ncbi:helix-turn-helix domain-containing protein [Streptomyces physcomitrii]
MTARGGRALTFSELFALPATMDLRTAARALGMSPGTAYRMIGRGLFPCEFLRIGRRYRVLTASVLRTLGIEEMPVYGEDVARGAAAPEPQETARSG